MKVIQKILFMVFLFASQIPLCAQISLWAGESYTCDISSSIVGFTANMNWSSTGCLTLSGSSLYRTVTVPRYFSGTASVTVRWQYKLLPNDPYKNQSRVWTFTCKDNPVSISPTSLTLSTGQTAKLSYRLEYDNKYSSAAKPYFTSSNSAVATVTPDGYVTAVKEGTAYVNVFSNSSANSPYCVVTVKEIAPTSVYIQSDLTIVIGKTYTLNPILYPEGASTSFIWKSEDSNVASVNSSGVVTGIESGNTRIKVTTTKGNLSAYCNVTVKEPPQQPSAIHLKDKIKLYNNFSTALIPVLEPADSETSYSWSSSNPEVATVSSSGKITAKGVGRATIKVVTANGLSAETIVEVSETPGNIDYNVLKKRVRLIETIVQDALNILKNEK